MANISIVSRLVAGVQRQVDLSVNTLVVQALSTGVNTLTDAILGNLITLQNGTLSVSPTLHAHDGVYTRTTALASATAGLAGSTLIGDNASYTNFTPSAATVKGALSGIDSALAGKQASGSYITALTGDVTATGPNSAVATLAASGTAAGTFTKVTVDLKGRVTAGAQIASSDVTTALGYTPVNRAGDTMTGPLILSGDPVSALGAATKQYADNLTQGISWKTVARSATTAALPANVYANGSSGIGATLTASANAALTAQDSVTLIVGDRLLVKNETAQANNGIYTVTQVGSASLPYILTRATDDDTATKMVGSTIMIGSEASTQSGSSWRQSAPAPITMGTTAITFINFGAAQSYSFGNGLQTISNVVSVKSADASISVAVSGVSVVNDPAGAIVTGASGIRHNLETTNPTLQIATNQLGVKLDPARAITTGTAGIGVLVDNSTLDINASNQLEIKANGITNTQIAFAANIAYSKLNLGNSIQNSDISTSAGIFYSKLLLTNSIVSGDLTALSVTTNKINTAAVDNTKLATNVADQVTIVGGNGTPLSAVGSPTLQKSVLSGQAFAANTSYAVRWGIVTQSETSNSIYAADNNAATVDKFHVIGIAYSTTAVSVGQNITVIMLGDYTIQSSDALFSAATIGTPVYLGSAGALTATAPTTTNLAAVKIGIIHDFNKIWVDRQIMGVN